MDNPNSIKHNRVYGGCATENESVRLQGLGVRKTDINQWKDDCTLSDGYMSMIDYISGLYSVISIDRAAELTMDERRNHDILEEEDALEYR